VSKSKDSLSKNKTSEILQRYYGFNILELGSLGILEKHRTKPFDWEAIQNSDQVNFDDLQRCLAVKKISRHALDTHLGQLSRYVWLKSEHPAGAGFSPIFNAISKVKQKYPAELIRLESISRRLAYLCLLEDEIEYMNKKYDYEEIPIIFEFNINKIEVFTTLLVELLMILAELWCDRPGTKITPGPRPKGFEDIFDCFTPLEQGGYQFFRSINIMLQLSAAISARHQYVHRIGPSIKLSNGVIEFDIPVKERFGEFELYMEIDLYDRLEKLPPSDEKTIAKDSRFPEFDFEIRRSKKGKFDYYGSDVRYRGTVPQYVKMLERVLWMISRAVFTAILE
jgi:hypothetical protein